MFLMMQPIALLLVLSAPPDELRNVFLGLQAVALETGGVRLTHVEIGSAGERAGLLPADIIKNCSRGRVGVEGYSQPFAVSRENFVNLGSDFYPSGTIWRLGIYRPYENRKMSVEVTK